MNKLVNNNDGIISFSLYKTEKGREKICKCDPPHYILDDVNRIITCEDCGATIDPFEALLTINRYMDEFVEYQEEAMRKINTYREWADKEWRRRCKNRACKEMDANYHQGMYPHCPKCNEVFDPAKVTRYSRISKEEKE